MKLLNSREWKDPKTGKVYWRVRYNNETGKECVKVFGTPEEADKHIGTVHKAREKHGRAAAANAEEVAALSIWRAFAQGELTAGRDAPSLRDAMRTTIERLKDGMTSPPLGKLRDQFLLAKQTEKVSKRHEHAMKSALKRFVSYFDALEPAGSLTTADVDKALGSMSAGGLAPQSVKNIRAIAHNLFQWALDRDLVSANPVTRTKAPKVTQGEVGTITPSQLQGFLRTALRVLPQSVPAFAVWAFCGLRRAEIARLSYEDLNQERKELRVSAKVAKTGVARFVPMPTALLEWLSAAKAAGVLPVGKLVPGELETTSEGYLCRWFRDIHKQDGLAKWPHNALRHSFASHAAAMHDDFAKVAAWLGHSRDPRLLVTRYRQMTINEKGNNAIIRENATLTKQVTTLKNSLATLSSRPSKSELRSLFLQEKGIQLMYIKIPSFASHWETYKIEADAELEKVLAGRFSWPRQIIRRSLGFLFTDKSLTNFPPNPGIDLKTD